ncbi:MAG: hypothetical protein J5564_00740 [Clostridia bacterium]|nr:hypothetical protein [Clostridia bacterium]
MSRLDYQGLKDLGLNVKCLELCRSISPMYITDNGDGTYDISGTFVFRGLTRERLFEKLEELADQIIND